MLEKVNLPKLENLDLFDNYIIDINVLEKINLPNLKEINLFDNNIEDISVFEKIDFKNLKLKYISLRDNKINKETNISLIEKIKSKIDFFI